MQESDERPGIPSGCLLPVNPLTLKVYSTKDRPTLAMLGLSHFLLDLDPLPASVHIGLVAKMRFIDEQHGDILRLAPRQSVLDDLIHPTFFSSELGAWAGIVLAKRLYTQPPCFRALLTVLALTSRP